LIASNASKALEEKAEVLGVEAEGEANGTKTSLL
jgi:hypothetical protein